MRDRIRPLALIYTVLVTLLLIYSALLFIRIFTFTTIRLMVSIVVLRVLFLVCVLGALGYYGSKG